MQNQKSVAGRITICLLVLLILWGLTHVWTLSWGLPALSEQAPDCMIARPGLSVVERMRGSTYTYPPLQYLLTHSCLQKDSGDDRDVRMKSTQRILVYRWFCAIMELWILFAIFVSMRCLLRASYEASLLGAILFLCLPVSLFYSHTSNLDIPSTFWVVSSALAAGFAERMMRSGKPGLWMIFHLICGCLIGCAFCTKDQVYALYILPAFWLVFWRYRQGSSFVKAMIPLFFWGMTFLCTAAVVYSLSGGISTIYAHFSWVVGSGRTDFYMTPDTLSGRMQILWLQLRDLIAGMDWPLLSYGIVLLAMLVRAKILRSFWRRYRFLLVMLFLCLVSQQVFFLQATRSSYVRFLIPLLIPVCMICALGFDRLQKKSQFRILVYSLTGLVLILQAGIANQTLWNLDLNPATQIRQRILAEKLPESMTVATIAATAGTYYRYEASGEQTPLSAIRSWGRIKYDFAPYRLPDLYPTSFFFEQIDPQLVIVAGEDLRNDYLAMLLTQKILIPHSVFRIQTLFPTLWQYQWPAIHLLVRNRQMPLPASHEFDSQSLPEQLMQLSYLTSQMTRLEEAKLKKIGQALNPFTFTGDEPYYITSNGLQAAFWAYELAGRSEEGKRVQAYLTSKCRK